MLIWAEPQTGSERARQRDLEKPKLTARDGLWGGGHPDVVLRVRGILESVWNPQRSCLGEG